MTNAANIVGTQAMAAGSPWGKMLTELSTYKFGARNMADGLFGAGPWGKGGGSSSNSRLNILALVEMSKMGR